MQHAIDLYDADLNYLDVYMMNEYDFYMAATSVCFGWKVSIDIDYQCYELHRTTVSKARHIIYAVRLEVMFPEL